jgi:rSAM/selenodomain-associated transferase 2
MRISIIIPTLNEAEHIKSTLMCLEPIRMDGHEVIVVDGGSKDATVNEVKSRADIVITSAPGRALQMNAGARQATGDVLWFLHADSQVSRVAAEQILLALKNQNNYWGRFNIRLSGKHILFRIVELLMNLRSRLTGIATGDQGIFVRRDCFEAIGGFSKIPLMEDIEISRRLKKWSWPCCIHDTIKTSSRRWEEYGILSTVLLMWRLRLAYAFGVSPEKLAHEYKAGK